MTIGTVRESGERVPDLKSTGVALNVAQRKAGIEYHHQVTSPLQGLDLDANEGVIDPSRFWDLRNWRIDSPGSIVIRTGHREHSIIISSRNLKF